MKPRAEVQYRHGIQWEKPSENPFECFFDKFPPFFYYLFWNVRSCISVILHPHQITVLSACCVNACWCYMDRHIHNKVFIFSASVVPESKRWGKSYHISVLLIAEKGKDCMWLRGNVKTCFSHQGAIRDRWYPAGYGVGSAVYFYNNNNLILLEFNCLLLC